MKRKLTEIEDINREKTKYTSTNTTMSIGYWLKETHPDLSEDKAKTTSFERQPYHGGEWTVNEVRAVVWGIIIVVVVVGLFIAYNTI